MGIEAYLAHIREGGLPKGPKLDHTVDADWRAQLKPHIFEKSIKTGVGADELRRMVAHWPRRLTLAAGFDVHPLDVSLGPFWPAYTTTAMAWANLDFDATCRDCIAHDTQASCSHKDPLDAAVEVAWADAYRFHERLERAGLQASGFVDGRFQAGDYTLVLSGRRGVGILLGRLLGPEAYQGLRQVLEDIAREYPTLDKAALRATPGPVRVPLSQHPGERGGERMGLRLPLDPTLLGPRLAPDEARILQAYSLTSARAARAGAIEPIEHLARVFAAVMLPQAQTSDGWDEFAARLAEEAPPQFRSTRGSKGVPSDIDIKHACRDLGLYRGDGPHSVLVWCPCCGENTAWLTGDKTLWCFRKKCSAAANRGGLGFDRWVHQSSLPPARILRVFAQCGADSHAHEHAVSALGGLIGRGLPFSTSHVRPANTDDQTNQTQRAFFDPWLTAYYGPSLSQATPDLELRADAEGILNAMGSGRLSLDELPPGARRDVPGTEVSSKNVSQFEYYTPERWRELARRLAAVNALHLEFDTNPDFVWLSLENSSSSKHVRLVTNSQVLAKEPIHDALAGLDTLCVSTTDDIRHLLDDGVPYTLLRTLPIRTLELPVRLLNNSRRGLQVPFSRWRLAYKLQPEVVSPLEICELLFEAVETHELAEVCRLENAIAVDVAALERNAPRVDTERIDEVLGRLEKDIAALRRPLQRFLGPCANVQKAGDVEARFAEEGITLENLRESTLEHAAEAATGATARRLDNYIRWKQKRTMANDLRMLDAELTDDGRARPRVDQLGTCTGRFSWSRPPLASISKRARKHLMPAPGRRFVSLDISQAQLRIAAELSGDRALLQVFEAKDDVHNVIARQLFGGEPTGDQRSQAKAVSFGVLLGMGATTLVEYADNFGAEISEQEAGELIDRFFEQFPQVRQYRNDLFWAGRRRGAVVAPSGRRCKLGRTDDDIHPGTTLAYVLQMTEADVIKSALLRACERLDLSQARPAMVLHDELIVEAESEYVDEASAILKRALAESLSTFLQACPIGALEVEVAKRWG